jgi:hypothetical protein
MWTQRRKDLRNNSQNPASVGEWLRRPQPRNRHQETRTATSRGCRHGTGQRATLGCWISQHAPCQATKPATRPSVRQSRQVRGHPVETQTQPRCEPLTMVAAQKRAEMPSCAAHSCWHAEQHPSASPVVPADKFVLVGLGAVTLLICLSFVYRSAAVVALRRRRLRSMRFGNVLTQFNPCLRAFPGRGTKARVFVEFSST